MQTPSRKVTYNPESSRKHDHQCVCQICTCGKHSCPEPQAPFDAHTSYQRDYKPYKVAQQTPNAGKYVHPERHYDPGVLKSTYGANYKEMPIQTEKKIEPAMEYRPNRGKFEGQSEYKKSYVPSKIEAEKPMAPLNYKPKTVKFQGNTTYNREFSPKAMEKPLNVISTPYKPKQLPFQGSTTYDRQFKSHKIEQQRPYTHAHERYTGRQSRFQGESRYRQEYKHYEIDRPKVCEVERLPARPGRCSPGKTHLHYSAEKNKWE